MRDRDYYIERIKKVKRLAREGSPGEREAAERLLAQLMERHGVEDDELEERTPFFVAYTSNAEHTVLTQVCFRVLGNDAQLFALRQGGRKLRKIEVYATPQEKDRILVLWAIFRKELAEQMRLFVRAFVQKNDLFAEDSPSRSLFDMTDEERAEALRMAALAHGLPSVGIPREDQRRLPGPGESDPSEG